MRFGHLDLNLLVALDALMVDCSVSSAAKQLGVTQPAMTAALNRLRDYFKDDLLVQSGRQMLLTPRAQELQGPVRDVLMLVAARISTPGEFIPAIAERQFSILASDYMFDVLLAATVADLASAAPRVSFDFLAMNRMDHDGLARGEIDILITLKAFLVHDHPRSLLLTEEHAVIAWSEGDHASSLTEEEFFDAGHAVPLLGVDRHPAFSENYLMHYCRERRIEVKVPSFNALAQSIVGTHRIATMYRRHADFFAKSLPIIVHKMPFQTPTIDFYLQWHESRTNDAGLRWFRDVLQKHA